MLMKRETIKKIEILFYFYIDYTTSKPSSKQPWNILRRSDTALMWGIALTCTPRTEKGAKAVRV